MIVLPCTNDDQSCGPQAFHRFPQEGETVTLTCTEARIIGSQRMFDTTAHTHSPMSGVVTDHAIPEAHQVGVRLQGNNYDVTVWVDVDDDIKEIA